MVLHAAGYKKEAVDIFSIYEKDRERYEMKDDMKRQVLELVNRTLNREGIMFGVVNTSGWHFLSGDDTFPLVVCIEEADGVVEHAVGIWKGKIYNPNQMYVLEQSRLAFDAVCVKHQFRWLKELYQLKIMAEVQSKRKKEIKVEIVERKILSLR